MKMGPRYQIGDRVKHVSCETSGVVERTINLNDPEDVRQQGYRYEVRVGRNITWSVPEKRLVGR